ncbi:MAG TPA: iron ABC transporter permease [Micromonosporaceae bacterium]|jgi:iron(III) transport system permease protein|nr:iron ABC transporter permease [Micromonosporaceae bacterium]
MALLADRPTNTATVAEPVPRRRTWRDLVEPRYIALTIAALAVAYLALVPVGTMLYASAQSDFLGFTPSTWTLHNYVKTFTADGTGSLIANSFIYAAATAIVSTVFGFGLAWLVVRTNTPAKGFARVAALVPLIIPGILNTVAWSLMLSPERGPVNVALRNMHLPIFNVFSLTGMVFVQSIHVIPVAYLMGTAAFTSLDSSLEEAALASGSSPIHTFRAITLRLARPAILSAALLMFVQTISTFEVPQLIGVPARRFVFVSRIYSALQSFPPDYGTVGVLGVFVLVVACLGLFLSRRLSASSSVATITGKGFRPRPQDIGRWRWLGLAGVIVFFLIAVALPILMLIWSSLLRSYQQPSIAALHDLTFANFGQILKRPGLAHSVQNSLITAVAAGLIVTTLSAVVAYITVKSKVRGRGILDGLATIPIAVPSVIMGVGILFWYLVAPIPVHLYGTLTILTIAFVTITLPYGMRYLSPGMAQIKDELEEAATASGASWLQSFRRVFIPLLMPSLLAAFIYTMIVAFREISAAIFLYTSNTEVVSVQVYDLYANGSYTVVAALGVVMVVFLSVLAAAVRLISRRVGIKSG